MDERIMREYARLGAEAQTILDAGGSRVDALRVGLDRAIEGLPSELKFFREHGIEVDGGSYYLGSQIAAFIMRGVHPPDVIHDPEVGPLLKEYIEKARKL